MGGAFEVPNVQLLGASIHMVLTRQKPQNRDLSYVRIKEKDCIAPECSNVHRVNLTFQ